MACSLLRPPNTTATRVRPGVKDMGAKRRRWTAGEERQAAGVGRHSSSRPSRRRSGGPRVPERTSSSMRLRRYAAVVAGAARLGHEPSTPWAASRSRTSLDQVLDLLGRPHTGLVRLELRDGLAGGQQRRAGTAQEHALGEDGQHEPLGGVEPSSSGPCGTAGSTPAVAVRRRPTTSTRTTWTSFGLAPCTCKDVRPSASGNGLVAAPQFLGAPEPDRPPAQRARTHQHPARYSSVPCRRLTPGSSGPTQMCTSGRLRPNQQHHSLGGADDQATFGFEHAQRARSHAGQPRPLLPGAGSCTQGTQAATPPGDRRTSEV